MAAGQHKVSRRALLGAVVAAPVLCHHAGLNPESSPPPPGRASRWLPDQVRGDGKWAGALARFESAWAILAAAAQEPDQDRYDALLGASSRALRRLLRTPAPDVAALAVKIELAVDHDAAGLTGGEACMETIKQDARRLAAAG